MEPAVIKILKEKGIPFRLIKLNGAAITVEDVVTFSNGEVILNEICKTVIVKGRKTGKLYGLFLQGTDKISFTKVKKVTGEEMTMGDVSDVKIASGVEPGAVCPFLLSVQLLVDNKIEGMERVNCGSGEHLFGLEFNPKDLKTCVEYVSGDFIK